MVVPPLTARPAAPPVRRRQDERSEQARSGLLLSARSLIAADGIERLTLEAVGRDAGYSRGIVGYHFGSKSGLIAALLENAVDDLVALFQRDEPPSASTAAAVLAAMRDRIARDPYGTRFEIGLLARCSAADDPLLRDRVALYNKRVREIFSSIKGPDGAGNPAGQQAGAILLAAIRGLCQQWLVDEAFDIIGAFTALENMLRPSSGR